MTDLSKMTEKELSLYKIEVDRVYCLKSFYYFLRESWPVIYPNEPFVDGKHIAAICYHAQAAIEGKAYSENGDVADTIVINVPPGCGKSRIVSVFLSGWLWAIDPSMGQWFSSFGYGILDRDSLDTRRLIESDWFKKRFWEKDGIKLTDDQNQKRRFNNSAGGWRLAASIGSKSGFGEHPSVLCIDDPHDPEQALGEQRFIAIDAWDRKYSTRGVVKGVIKIVIAQRLGEGDLCGHIFESEDDVVRCVIPMWYESHRHSTTDIEYLDIDQFNEDGSFKKKRGWEDWRTEDGELMWPDVMTEKKVEKLKTRLRTAHMISAQLQQNPTSPQGDMFQSEYISYVDAPPTHGVCVRAWDKAGTQNRKADFTAGCCLVYDGDFFYICDMRRFKAERREREAIIMNTAKQDEQTYPDYTIVFEQTPSHDGKEAAQINASRYIDAGFKVRLEKARTNKEARAETLADAMAAGRVKIVRGGWNKKFVSELLSFPSGAHDDQVDAASMAIKKAQKSVKYGTIRRPLLLLTEEEQQEMDVEEQPETEFDRYLRMTEVEDANPLGIGW